MDGIGEVLADGILAYFAEEKNQEQIDQLLEILEVEKPEQTAGEKSFQGMTFVITGSLVHFTNRKELQERIEALGGKVAGSVSAKTTYLVNNDVTSNSSKNKKARELGIPILSEEEIIKMLGE